MTHADGDVDESKLLDLDGCAALLGVRRRYLQRTLRRGEFIEPAGLDGEPFWDRTAVWRWAATQGPALANVVPMNLWPGMTTPAEFVGAVRLPAHYGDDDVVLTWAATPGRVAMIWRSTDPIMLNLADLADRIDADAIVAVDPDFGIDGPRVRAINTVRPGQQYGLAWRDLARVLGQPIPYWPSALRIPELVESWQPGAAGVIAPARPELDTTVLLRMAAMFEPSHATHCTLENLARIAQHRGTRDALGDLRILDQCLERFRDEVDASTTVVAAHPLVVGDADTDPEDEQLDETIRRIGWLELLHRDDLLTWRCVREALTWDGGADMPFSHPTTIDVTTAAGREWAARLEPIATRTAAFAHIDDEGDALSDPATGAPAVRQGPEKVRTALPQRLPTNSKLAELILGTPIWVRTADGILYPLPQSPTYGSSWGYGGGGPGNLAVITAALLDDITAQASGSPSGAPEGLQELTRLAWPAGTVLSRAILEAARDNRPYGHPNKPAVE